jgi:excisionase family DNA binding protein
MPINDRDLDELLTPEEAAEVLHVSRATIYRMIAARQIEVVRVGTGHGRARITRRMLLDGLNRRTVKPDRRTRSA